MTDPWGNPLPPQHPGSGRPTTPPGASPEPPAPPSADPPPPPGPPAFDPAWPGRSGVDPAWPGQPAAPIAGPRTSGPAVTALVLGIASITCAGFLGIVLAPLAIVFGVRARRAISASNGWRTGDGLAMAGIVLGIIGIVISVTYLAFVLSNPNFLPDLLDRLSSTTTIDGEGVRNA